MASAEPPDLALHATLLVGTPLARLTEERVELVMRAQRDEAVGLGPVAALQDPADRRPQVVIADPSGHPAESRERIEVPFEQRLLALRGEGDVDRPGRMGQAQVEDLDLGQDSGDPDARLAEVGFTLGAGRMDLGHGHEHRP